MVFLLPILMIKACARSILQVWKKQESLTTMKSTTTAQTHYQLLYNNQLALNWNLNLALHYTRGMGFFEQYKAGEALEDYGLNNVNIGGEEITKTDLIRRRWLDNDYYGATYGLILNFRSPSRKLDFTLGGGYHIYEGLHFGEIIWAEFASNSEIGGRYYENDARKSDFNILCEVQLRVAT